MSNPLPAVSFEKRQVITEPATMCESEIVSGLQRGEQPAWSALYDVYSVRVWRYVARLVGNDATVVSDIVQETMLAAASSAVAFDALKGTLWQWLTGIAHHRVAQHWQQEQRWQRAIGRLTGNPQETDRSTSDPYELLCESTSAPDSSLQQQEQAEIIRCVLAHLPEDYAALLVAKYVDELSLIEIQQQTGGTSDAVRSKMVRARQLFRETYTKLSDV